MFFCDNITAFGSFVVPDVKSIIDILLSSTFTFSNLSSLFFIKILPFSNSSENNSISLSFMLSIQINLFSLTLLLFFNFFITSIYFLSNIAISASLLVTNVSISFSGKALSIGTTTIPPHVIAK